MKFLTSLLLLVATTCFGALPDYKAFRGTGGITITSNPPIGTIVIDGTGIAGPTNGVSATVVTSIVTTVVGNSFIAATTNIVWVSKAGNDATGQRNRMDLPFATLTAANAASITWDLVKVLPGTYDTGTNHVKMKHGVSLMGSGVENTFLLGGGNFVTNGCIVNPGSTSSVSHLTICGTNNTILQGPFGCGLSPMDRAFTNVIIHNVRLKAESDCFYISTNAACSFEAFNCIAETKWDAYAAQGSANHRFKFKACTFYSSMSGATLAQAISQGSSTCINHGAGTVELIGCDFESTNANTATIVNVGAASAKVYLSGGQWRAAGTNLADFINNDNGGTVVAVGMDYVPSDISGSITGWASQFKQITYSTATGLQFLDSDAIFPTTPIFISPSGGLTVGSTLDPGASNVSVHGSLSLSNLTRSRPLFLNVAGNVTNASGTPDGTKFVRDDGVLAVPAGSGGGNVSSNNAGGITAIGLSTNKTDLHVQGNLVSAGLFDTTFVGDFVLQSDPTGQAVESAVSTLKLGYLNNVTSDIQTQLNTKGNVSSNSTGGITGIGPSTNRSTLNVLGSLTADKIYRPAWAGDLVLITDTADGAVESSTTTTELGYLNNVTSDIQTQLNSKSPGGNSGAVQFNETGAFAGTNRLYWDRTNNIFIVEPRIALRQLNAQNPLLEFVNSNFVTALSFSIPTNAGGTNNIIFDTRTWTNGQTFIVHSVVDAADGIRRVTMTNAFPSDVNLPGVGYLRLYDDAHTEYFQVEAPFDVATNNVNIMTSNGMAGVMVRYTDGTGTNRWYAVPYGTGMFTNNGAGVYGWMAIPSGGGATALSNLTDVVVTNMIAGDVLEWNSAMNKWTNFSPFFTYYVLQTTTNIFVGTNSGEQSVSIKTNASFKLVFTGTPQNGEVLNLSVSNYSASIINMTNSAFDTTVASNVLIFAIPALSIRQFTFFYNTNFNLGVGRWELRNNLMKEVELAVTNGLTLTTNVANSIITIGQTTNLFGSVTGVGTDFSAGNSLAPIVFGTTSPVITIPSAGTYRVFFQTMADSTIAGDLMALQLTNTTSGGLLGVIGYSSVPGISGRVTMQTTFRITVSGSTTLTVFGANFTAARGTFYASVTTIEYDQIK